MSWIAYPAFESFSLDLSIGEIGPQICDLHGFNKKKSSAPLKSAMICLLNQL